MAVKGQYLEVSWSAHSAYCATPGIGVYDGAEFNICLLLLKICHSISIVTSDFVYQERFLDRVTLGEVINDSHGCLVKHFELD